ncbi:MAG TPA: TonB-dependent receptor, partial [Bacteroidales bacterium]|nr:TonB-dependent receptor [Bacteroidales bacterium]
RHDVSIALTHKFNERIDIGSVWIYGSGNAVTLGIMEYSPMDYFIPRYFRDEKITEFPYRNNYRAPAYHRLDLSLNLHKKKNKGIRTWNFAIYNVYNRRNPFFIFWDDEYFEEADPFNPGMTVTTARPVLKKASLFPIIPSVTYSFIF